MPPPAKDGPRDSFLHNDASLKPKTVPSHNSARKGRRLSNTPGTSFPGGTVKWPSDSKSAARATDSGHRAPRSPQKAPGRCVCCHRLRISRRRSLPVAPGEAAWPCVRRNRLALPLIRQGMEIGDFTRSSADPDRPRGQFRLRLIP